ncbi:MAG: 4Fe-4S dicluster domain-containing protein [Oscillospiraceae bacterium]|nr:4Fe-4S dicluster domain-containing protein [Oscillospiraceae bacterium]
MANVIVIDVAKCSGCHNCQLACKDEHCENDWMPYAKPQPLTGQFWCKVTDHVRGTVPKVRVHYISRLCAHCENAPCKSACPSGAIYRRDDKLVIIDPDKCVGCEACVEACPYDAIYFNEDLRIAQKCTGCAHLLDNGYKMPRCVEACPTDAMVFGDENDEKMKALLKDAAPLDPNLKIGERVFYKNIPGQFISATIYDPVEKEVVIGAKCHLTGCGLDLTAETDSYGDFWFRDLPKGEFALEITAHGYEPLSFDKIDTSDCVNLGDVPMQPVK